MKPFFAILSAALILALSSSAEAGRVVGPFPLDREVQTDSFGGGETSVHISCIVEKKENTFLYRIALTFKSEEKMLLSWDYADWILSQYPNAIELNAPGAHLFPIRGEGAYTFQFESKESPLWYEGTSISLFPAGTNADDQKNNKRVAKEYSGVDVSSYDYLKSKLGLYVSICLPPSLRVFTYGRD